MTTVATDWPEVRTVAPPGDEVRVELLEAWLLEAGALSVTLLDSEDEPGDDTGATLEHAVLEPAPGETRLWRAVTLIGLFAQGSAASDIRAALETAAAAFALEPVPAFEVRALADAAWEREWMRDFRPMRFGARFVVAPHAREPVDGAGWPDAAAARADDVVPRSDDVVLRLDPGLAFGTGTHPTTALCLEWLGAATMHDAEPLRGRRVLDYGCGSGVLAIGAALLGAREIVAVDIDPQALQATADNARANGVAERLRIGLPGELVGRERDERFDVLLANILHGPLSTLAGTFEDALVDGGALVMSGLLSAQSEALRLRYTPWFVFEPDVARDGWVLLKAVRRSRVRSLSGRATD